MASVYCDNCRLWQHHLLRQCPLRTQYCLLGVLLAVVQAGPSAASTIVRYDTSYGSFGVRLYDAATPESVDNFLNYARNGDYAYSIIHRSIPGFVIQGGGFWPIIQNPSYTVQPIPTDPPVINEPGISNRRGTLAYAKVGGDPNSATSGWFFNLSDNTAGSPFNNLDQDNGGFTVFGRVLLNGMQVVDAIASLPRRNTTLGFYSFPTLPVFGFADPEGPLLSELVLVYDVVELDLPAGDYNFDGVVDAADYTVWRDTRGSTVAAEADGNGNGVVDQADYDLWQATFGETAPPPAALTTAGVAVPEPSSLSLLFLLLVAGGLLGCRRSARLPVGYWSCSASGRASRLRPQVAEVTSCWQPPIIPLSYP